MIRLKVGGDLQGTEVLIATDGIEHIIANPRGGSHIVMKTGQKFIVAESLDDLLRMGIQSKAPGVERRQERRQLGVGRWESEPAQDPRTGFGLQHGDGSPWV